MEAQDLPEEPEPKGPITADEILDARQILRYWERDFKSFLLELRRHNSKQR